VKGLWFSPVTLVSSTNKTDHHSITEILLKVALNTITLTPNPMKISLSNKYSVLVKVNIYIFQQNITDRAQQTPNGTCWIRLVTANR